MRDLMIDEVAKRAAVRPSAIRYYEAVGVLPPPRRVGGQRRYDEGVLARLAVVRLAQEVGFTIAEVRELVAGYEDQGVAAERWRELARRKLTAVEAHLVRAERMRRVLVDSLGCDCPTLDACSLVLNSGQGSPAGGDQAHESWDAAGGNGVQ